MSIFNFWNKKNENSPAMITTLPVMNPSMSAAEEVETKELLLNYFYVCGLII